MVRFKNRYFTVEIIPEDSHHSSSTGFPEALPLKENDIYKAVYNVTEKIHGEFGAAAIMTGLSVKYCNEHTRIGVIRCRHGPHRLLASSLPFMNKIGMKKVQVQGIYTGATIVKCFRFLQNYHKERLGEALRLCKNEVSKEKITKILSNINYLKEFKE